MVLGGHPGKNVAADLGISQRTDRKDASVGIGPLAAARAPTVQWVPTCQRIASALWPTRLP
jgi:hypothetical protein